MPFPYPALVLLLAIAMDAALAAEDAAIKSEILALERQIAQIDVHVAGQPAPEIAAAAAGRKEVLLLSKSLLENQLLAAAGGARQTLVVPVQPADPERATQLFREIAATQARIAAFDEEPDPVPEGTEALSVQQRMETEKMTLARLQLAYLQAQYGLPWVSSPLAHRAAASPPVGVPAPAAAPDESPAVLTTVASPPVNVPATPPPPTIPTARALTTLPESASAASPSAVSTSTTPAAPDALVILPAPAWGDRRYPQIDYHAPWFALAHQEDDEIAGWWSIQHGSSALDGRAQALATNHSQQIAGTTQHGPVFSARCWNQETAVIVLQDGDRVPSGKPAAIRVEYRLDEGPVRSTRWDALEANQGAGVFGPEAIALLRQVYQADVLVVRLVDVRGPLGEATFDLLGATQAIDAVADACGWLPFTLTSADYREIQTLLAATGYSPGPADGQWGPASRRAMKRFQEAAGREATGEPDNASLRTLGFSGRQAEAAR